MANTHLIVAGCHKSGTTSLYTYLSWHPDIRASPVKEMNFFMEHPGATAGDYERAFGAGDERITVEASPDYFYGGSVLARRIRECLPRCHVVILARNPADKIFEQFNHDKKVMGISKDESFDDYINHLSTDDVWATYRNGVRAKEERVPPGEQPALYSEEERLTRLLVCGFLHDDMKGWIEAFDSEDLSVVWFDDFARDPGVVLKALSQKVGFDPGFYEGRSFPIENESWVYQNAWLHRFSRTVFKSYEAFFRKHYAVKRRLRQAYRLVNGATITNGMSDVTRQCLNQLYSEDLVKLHDLATGSPYQPLPSWLISAGSTRNAGTFQSTTFAAAESAFERLAAARIAGMVSVRLGDHIDEVSGNLPGRHEESGKRADGAVGVVGG